MTSSTSRRNGSPGLARGEGAGLGYLSGGRGPALVLLHGIPGSAHTWERVAERLLDRYRVVLPDLAGFGRSQAPPGDGYMEDQARCLRALLDHLEIAEFALGGHDFGGPVAVTLMRLFPELRVRALILSATNLFTDTHVPPPLRLAGVPGLGTLAYRLLAGNRAGLRLMHLAATRARRGSTWSGFRRHLTPSAVDLTWRIFHRSLRDLRGNYGPVQGQLGEIRAPTLVLWGDADPFFPVAVAERSRDAVAGARLVILPHTGHFVPEERPDQAAEAMRGFLEPAIVPVVGTPERCG